LSKVEGMATHKPSRILFNILILLFISQLPFFSTHAQETITNDLNENETHADLLIILSPQYCTDNDIRTAIYSYITAVKNDLGWSSQIISIKDHENTYQSIDKIIEAAYQNHPLKACLMVGEDLNTALGGDCDYLEQPNTLPWSTLGGPTAYSSTDDGILCKLSTIQICISLLYPTHDQSYEQKKSSLVFAFNKFANQRNTTSPNAIRVLESSDLNINPKAIYQQLNNYGNVIYSEDATESDLIAACGIPYSAFIVHGHSTPAGTDVNRQKNSGWFTAENLDILKTSFFGADGCYTAGWWSNHSDNNQLDPSIDAIWYGSKIFTSSSLQAMALGLLSQTGFSTPVSFLENVMPELLAGKTLADAIIGDSTIGDFVIIGDPSFHFTL
jgi:hypothetical protein